MSNLSLFEIKKEIAAFGNEENFVDMETGEILDPEALNRLRSDEYKQLQMDKEEKIDNIIMLRKSKAAMVEARKQEIKKLMNANKADLRTIAWCDNTTAVELQGKKRETPLYKASFRTSESVEYDDWHTLPNEVLVEQEPKVSKTKLKKMLKDGAVIKGARLVKKKNLIVH